MLYFASFGVILIGIIVYSVKPTSLLETSDKQSPVSSPTWLQFLSYQNSALPADILVLPLDFGIIPLQSPDSNDLHALLSHNGCRTLDLSSDTGVGQSANDSNRKINDSLLGTNLAITMATDVMNRSEEVFCTHL